MSSKQNDFHPWFASRDKTYYFFFFEFFLCSTSFCAHTGFIGSMRLGSWFFKNSTFLVHLFRNVYVSLGLFSPVAQIALRWSSQVHASHLDLDLTSSTIPCPVHFFMSVVHAVAGRPLLLFPSTDPLILCFVCLSNYTYFCFPWNLFYSPSLTAKTPNMSLDEKISMLGREDRLAPML